jgi:hypothetical protein
VGEDGQTADGKAADAGTVELGSNCWETDGPERLRLANTVLETARRGLASKALELACFGRNLAAERRLGSANGV